MINLKNRLATARKWPAPSRSSRPAQSSSRTLDPSFSAAKFWNLSTVRQSTQLTVTPSTAVSSIAGRTGQRLKFRSARKIRLETSLWSMAIGSSSWLPLTVVTSFRGPPKSNFSRNRSRYLRVVFNSMVEYRKWPIISFCSCISFS